MTYSNPCRSFEASWDTVRNVDTDSVFTGPDGGGHINMYRAWVDPDMYPREPQPRLANWQPDDLAAYCGGEYTTMREDT